MERRINRLIKRLYWSLRLGKVEEGWYKGRNVILNHPKCLYFGRNVSINRFSCFMPCTEYAGIKYTPKIVVGDNVVIGVRNSFAAIDGVYIGNNVLFAGFVHVTDHSHGYEDITRPINGQPLISKGPVVIDDDCWLGFNCEILSGVHIGRHSVVAAHAVVTRDVPAYSIVAGNPARVIKRYDENTKTWISVK